MKIKGEVQLTVTKEGFEKIKDFKVVRDADVIDKSFGKKIIITWSIIEKRDRNKILKRINKKDLSFIFAQIEKGKNSYLENIANTFIKTQEDYNILYN